MSEPADRGSAPRLRLAVRRGLRRRPGPQDNQDSGYAGPWLLAVCDGVGGAARGDIASATAITQLRRLDEPPGSDASDELLARVAGAVHRAHDRLVELVDEDPALNGTSTTATVARLRRHPARRSATSATAGPTSTATARSRQLTLDHTFVQTLIDEGRITEEEARVHPHRNLILRAIDAVSDSEPDLFVARARRRGPAAGLQRRRLRRPRGRPAGRHPVHRQRRSTPPSSWSAPASRPGSSDNVTCVVADVLAADDDVADADGPGRRRRGRAPPAPQRTRPAHGRALPRAPLRRHRRARPGARRPARRRAVRRHRLRPRGRPLRAPPAAPLRLGSSASSPLAVVVGIGWIGVAAVWSWSQHQYYVGEQDGRRDLPRRQRLAPAASTSPSPTRPPTSSSTGSPTSTPARSQRRHRRRRPRRRPADGPEPRRATRSPIAATDGRWLSRWPRPSTLDGLRAPPPARRRALPARPRARRRHRRVRRGRHRRPGRGAGRPPRVRRLAGRAW